MTHGGGTLPWTAMHRNFCLSRVSADDTRTCMNDVSNGLHRTPGDIVFFVLCFLGVLLTAAGIITFTPWAAALGILAITTGLAYFALCQFL